MLKLQHEFYLQEDVVQVAKQLLGKKLVCFIDGKLTSGYITETEAYAGTTDKASHAYGGKYTKRTKTMYLAGGVAYVYLCYGIHHLFNVVTNIEGLPHAVLIRAVQPVDGIELMLQRTKKKDLKGLANGPGKLSNALGISTNQNGVDLLGDEIWIEDTDNIVMAQDVGVSPRIGIGYAQEHKDLPWRFEWLKP